MLISRELAAELGRETVRILQEGGYDSPEGSWVPIRALVRRAVEGTRSYPPDYALPAVSSGSERTQIEVVNETTLVAARRLLEDGQRPVALNFASALHPGGGFLIGARAQEESLAWSSGLYDCLRGNPMYEFHLELDDPLYSNYAVYSPDVPVIRDDRGRLLSGPWPCSFITSAAPNANDVLREAPHRREEIRQAFVDRIHKVLAIAVLHGHGAIVLGAWGCGAFGNDSRDIAPLFAQALQGPFQGLFSRVLFSIND